MVNITLSPCGIDCTTCKDFGKTCAGCREINGKVYWATYVDMEVCPEYDCSVNQKGLNHCGQCPELPCSIYYEFKDPSTSDEEHEKSIKDRTKVLKELAKDA